jgi:DNA-binding transcriptional LysR family regulator
MDVNLRQVRAFVCVAQLKSFTRAAALLHLSQPARTVQIRRLEESLGIKLFDRNTRAVELTRIGHELLPVFQRLLRDLDAVVLDTRDLAASRQGVVRIAVLPSFAAGLLPEVIAAFRKDHPRVTFVIRDAIANRVLAHVREDEVDIGITGGAVPPEFEIVSTVRDRLHVVFPARHAIGRAKSVTVDTLAQFPLILMDPETSVRHVVDAAFMDAGKMPVTACEAIYMMTAVGLVRAGLGIAILPGSAREIRSEPKLRSRPVDDPRFVRVNTVFKKRGRTLPPASAAFLETCVAALAKPPWQASA